MSKLTTINTRREFLTQGLGIVGVGAALPYGLVNTALAGPKAEQGQNITVILQLDGGNDALSALVPYGDPEYNKLRIETRVNENEVHKLDNYAGLNPSMKGAKALFDEGAFCAIPGVGYPNTNFSHFTATDIWETANPNPSKAMFGWVGKTCDSAFKGNRDPKLTVGIGSGKTSRALIGEEHPGLSFSNPESYRYTGDRGQEARAEVFRKLNTSGSGGFSSNTDFIKMTAGNANDSSDMIRQMAKEYKPKVDYPNSPLANNLKIIAGLISGGLSTRIYHTRLGGFDTHSGQRIAHDRLMLQIDEAVAAFYKDLKVQNQDKRVLTMTMSEFGRRVQENGSRGTDHGAAAALFMFGPGVKAGIHGKHPSLTDLQGGGGGSLKHTTDFRSVYATVIDKWIGGNSETVLGAKYPHIDCIA